MNYFDFFEIPMSFQLDEKKLKKQFLLNSKKYHPDFYTLESAEKQASILELSTLNNQAYKVLSDFDQRMAYVLKEKGVLAEEGNNSIPQSFLVEVMEIQESIMELEFGFDATAYNKALTTAESLDKELYEGIQPVITGYIEGKSSEEELRKVKEFYLKKKYLLRIQENLNRFAPASK